MPRSPLHPTFAHRLSTGSLPGRLGMLAMLAVLATVGVSQALAASLTAEEAAALDRRIMAEASKNSDIMANLTYLSDVIGPRLTGSANLQRASAWTAQRMKDYGLENVHLEGYTIPEGWERGSAYMRILEPENGRSLSIASLGWTPGTKGRIQGDVVVLDAHTVAELEKFKGKLKGAIVLQGAPAKLRPLGEMSKVDGGMPGVSSQPGQRPERPLEEVRAFRKTMSAYLQREGAAIMVTDAGKHFGLLNTTGGWRDDRPSATDRLPTLQMAHNHYELLYRLANRPASARTRVEVEVNNKFIPGPLKAFNTVGEIRGKDKPDEFVVVGAHLDSWDLGQGTTDNGTGSSVVLETARVLLHCGTAPRRTIRFVLFTGEEQGLHGSRAYVRQHKDEMPRISMCVAHDTGTGRVVGLGTGGRPELKKLLEKELMGLQSLGVKDYTTRSLGGSDHQSFSNAGVPGLLLRQEPADYRFTHHSEADTLDRARPAELIQGAQVLAIIAMRVANMDELMPRDKKVR
jgi:carboxypeptidase Q